MEKLRPQKILSSRKSIRKLSYLSESTFSDFWELTKRLQWSRNVYRRKIANLSENSKLCSLLTCPVPYPAHQMHSNLQNQQFTIIVETKSLAAYKRGQTGWRLYRVSFPEKYHYLNGLVAPWKKPRSKLSVFDLTQQ